MFGVDTECIQSNLCIPFTAGDSLARLWNLQKAEVVKQYHGHQSAVTCVALNDSNVI